MGKYSKIIILLASLLSLSLFLASCSSKQKLPQSALDKLEEQWQLLPSGKSNDLHIIRAWPGEKPTEQSLANSRNMEIWCVELEMYLVIDNAEESQEMLWIVTRPGKDAEWSAAPLMIMSSSWPYEACGDGF